MKTEFIDLSETRKNLEVEIPTVEVDREIGRLSKHYGRSVKVPGFRPGKVPAKVVRQRFRDQILNDVVNDLVPKAVNQALREHRLNAVGTPTIRDVTVEEGRPLTFTATFETIPPIDPGEYRSFTLRRSPVEIDDEAIDKALAQLRERAAKLESAEGRPVECGDTVTLDLERRVVSSAGHAEGSNSATKRHQNVTVEVGGTANPQGFDDELMGLRAGASHKFTLNYPDTHEVKELAGRHVSYRVLVKDIRQRVLPDLDDEFARDFGELDSLAALRDRVKVGLREAGERESDREVRADLLKQLATRVTAEVPDELISRDIDRRAEHMVSHLLAQRIDPRQANINWDKFRDDQRPAATDTVRSTLVLDEIAKREEIEVSDADIQAEIGRQAERSERTPAAMRALIEKEERINQLATGVLREKVIDFLLANATIVAV